MELSVTPKHGNAGGRFFPHTGHLGLSPVVVQGRVATKLPPSCGPLPVSAIALRIKCTESRSGGISHALWEQSHPLFAAHAGIEYVPLGDSTHDFRVSIPVEAAEQARSAMCIREYKVVWRLEVVIEHRPIPYVGTSITKAFALDLLSYRPPLVHPLSPPSPLRVGSNALVSQVCVSVPHGAFGPGDTLNIPIHVKPEEAGVTMKKVTVVLERLIELVDAKSSGSDSSPSKRRHIQPCRAPSPAQSSRISYIIRRSLSPRPPSFHRLPADPAIETEASPDGRLIRDKITEAVCTEMMPGTAGACLCAVTMTLPRRTGKWAMGETHHTGLVSISFRLKVSITLKGDRRSSPSKTFVCSSVPIVIAATAIAERSEAAAAVASHRTKRSMPGKGLYMQDGNSSILKSHSSIDESTEISPITGVATNVKPILMSPDKSPAPLSSQSISFVFPASPSRDAPPATMLPIHSLLNPESSSPSNGQLLSPPPTRSGLPPPGDSDSESASLLQRFQFTQGSGRRISTTNSEDEDIQPSRSRQKRLAEPESDAQGFGRPSLSSLDALGLGLPHVPDDGRPRSRRPVTAPIHSTFSMSRAVPPPLSGVVSDAMMNAGMGARPATSIGRMGSWRGGERDTFSFVMAREKENTSPDE